MTKVGEVKAITNNDNTYTIECDTGLIRIYIIKPNIIRVRATREKQFNSRISQIVCLKADEQLNHSINDDIQKAGINTDLLKIIIDKTNTNIIFTDKNNITLSEDVNGAFQYEGNKMMITKAKTESTSYYGIGERFTDLEAEGTKSILYNKDTADYENENQMYASIPFVLSNSSEKGTSCGIYSDNTYKTIFDFTEEGNYQITCEKGEIDYYFIYGEDPKEVISNYTMLTGRPQMPPLWSLGYHQSRWGYKNFKVINELIENFNKYEIPCDSIHLDIQYMDKCRVFTWDKKNFPAPSKYLKAIKNKNINIVTIIDPGVKKDEGYGIYKQGMDKDLFCKKDNGEVFYGNSWSGVTAFPDFFKEETHDWWATLVSSMRRLGVSGIWNDMNEPHLRLNGTPDIDNPDMYHELEGEKHHHSELRNLYAFFMARATYTGLIKEKYDERPFILTRSGFAGIQRYCAMWTGDNTSSWLHLQKTIPMLLNLGLSGISFCGADVGGFASGRKWFFPLHKKFKPSPELYVRWMELACLTPFFRTHTVLHSRDQEPWAFGEDVLNISKKYIKLRYELLPHLYNYFYISHSKGLPVMRPLFLNYPDDPEVNSMSDEFMIGDDMLVAPVIDKGSISREVYLPEGTWVDYHTGNIIAGGKRITVNAPLDTLPLFIKNGTIIPKYEPVLQTTADRDKSLLIIDVYADTGEKSYALYEDDGESNKYRTGEYSVTTYQYNYDSNKLRFNIKRDGNYLPAYKVIIINLIKTDRLPVDIKHITEEGGINKPIVKVSEDINFRTSTGMCWFIRGEGSKNNKESLNQTTVVIPNKDNMNICFDLIF